MPKTKFVDFKAVKAALSMKQVLSHYGLLDKFKRSGDALSGPCPIHKGENPTQFRVTISKNLWHCFSECKHGGNVLDFVAKMENCSIHAAALKAMEWFHLDPETMSADSQSNDDSGGGDQAESSSANAKPKDSTKSKVETKPEPNTPNAPLKFELEKLDSKHPYFAERGISKDAVAEFGLGFCSKGIMANRIAIPINNVLGELVAYAGRVPGEASKDVPKYKLPPGFRKGQELFNLDQAIKEPEGKPLVLVEGFFDTIKLWQNGYRKVAALMGSTMSAAQAKLIFDNTTPTSTILVMLDEDEAGRAGREDIVSRLSRFCFVKAHAFADEGMQPEHLTPKDLLNLLGGRQ